MLRWTGIVLALEEAEDAAMASRLPTWLHPIAGRPLVWHVVGGIAELEPKPERVVVLSRDEIAAEIFEDLPLAVEVVPVPTGDWAEVPLPTSDEPAPHALVLYGTSLVAPSTLQALLDGPSGRWVPAGPTEAAAAWIDASRLSQLARLPAPLTVPNGVLAAHDRLPDPHDGCVVRDRVQLAMAIRWVRDRLIRSLMLGGVTFMLPESVLVDVDVRIGRDSIVYPGAVLEGQTTIGEETVVGPSCRIVDSWVGSGVELKGWNYISHTSIRNRAILEPYVRRGFD